MRTCFLLLRIRSRRNTLTSRDCLVLLPSYSSSNSNCSPSRVSISDIRGDRFRRQLRTSKHSPCIRSRRNTSKSRYHHCMLRNHSSDDPKDSSSRVSISDIRGCRIGRQLRTCQYSPRIRSRRNTSTFPDCLDMLPDHSYSNPKHIPSLLWPIEATRDRSFEQLEHRTLLGSSCILHQHHCTLPSHPIDNSPTPIPIAISKTTEQSKTYLPL